MTALPARRLLGLGVALALALAPVSAAVAAVTPAPDTYPNDGTRVMFVGDSITGSPGCWRPQVWADLTNAAHNVNMVGIRTANECGDFTNDAGDPWDPDNTGIGGITTTRMWIKLERDSVLEATDPDVIVMLLGTNDLFGGATSATILTQYSALLTLFRDYDPSISVVVGTPPPMSEACGCAQAQTELAAALPSWAKAASTAASPVTVADLSTGFVPATDTGDGIHPNDAGNAKLATAWTPVISAALDAKVIAAQSTPEPDVTATASQPSPSPSSSSAEDAPAPTTRSWVVLALVGLVAVAVTIVMTRANKRYTQP